MTDIIADQAEKVSEDFTTNMPSALIEVQQIKAKMSATDYGHFMTYLNEDLSPELGQGFKIVGFDNPTAARPFGMSVVDNGVKESISFVPNIRPSDKPSNPGLEDMIDLYNAPVNSDGSGVVTNSRADGVLEVKQSDGHGGTITTDKGSAPSVNFTLTQYADGVEKKQLADGTGWVKTPDSGKPTYSEHHWGPNKDDNYDEKNKPYSELAS